MKIISLNDEVTNNCLDANKLIIKIYEFHFGQMSQEYINEHDISIVSYFACALKYPYLKCARNIFITNSKTIDVGDQYLIAAISAPQLEF